MEEHAHPISGPIACQIATLAPAERAAHQERIHELFGSLVRESYELPLGYTYRFDAEQYDLLASFIANERLCCPFLTFQLDIAPYSGPMWLQITAPGEGKAILSMVLRNHR